MVVKRRVYGPENSIPLESKKQPARTRNHDQIRPFFTTTGVNKSSGSCYLETENIKIIASIHLKQSKESNFNCDFKFAPFATKTRKEYQKDEQEKQYSLNLKNALHPSIRPIQNTLIDVQVLVLEDDGVLAALAAAITCASIALADSGIELYDLVTGCSAGVSEKNIILDLTEQEQEDLTSQELEGTKGCAFLVLATMSGLNEITLVEQTGSVSTKQSVRAIELCVDACQQIATTLHKVLIK